MRKKRSLISLPFLPVARGKIDFYLILAVVSLVGIGLLMVYDASSVIAEKTFQDKYRFLREQAIWAALGLTCMIIVSFIDYHFWKKLSFPILIATIIALIAVFLPGIGVKALGAARWIRFGYFIIQPAELAKIGLTLYLASWFSSKEQKKLSSFLLLIGVVIGLVMLEPDLGTSIVLGSIAIILYFLSGAPLKQFFLLIPAAFAVILVLIKIEPYRLNRFLTFLNPDKDPLGASYHIKQVLLGLGSGGIFGIGLGQSRQKYAYLPESTTDSIFAIYAEELGFLGGMILIAIFFIFLIRGFLVATKAKDLFGKLLASGITSFLMIQAIINLSAQVALMPFTGIPLPFISYGGSSLVVNLVSVGILLSISRTTYES